MQTASSENIGTARYFCLVYETNVKKLMALTFGGVLGHSHCIDQSAWMAEQDQSQTLGPWVRVFSVVPQCIQMEGEALALLWARPSGISHGNSVMAKTKHSYTSMNPI